MKFFLEKAAENLRSGLDFQESGELKKARERFLVAAEMMFKAAEKSEGPIRSIREKKAHQIMEKAQALEPYIKTGKRGEQIPSEEPSAQDWIVKEKPDIRFKDVAGLEDVKEEIHVRFLYPILYPDKAKKFGIKSGGGVLLYGPPGTGKTLIARAIAGETDAVFFTVKPSQVMSKWVGEAEQNIDRLFKEASVHPLSIIFIDEIEALIPKRRDSQSTVMQRVVPQILMELEGFVKRENVILFIGATNEPWSLDPAVLRPGRFDIKIHVGLPDPAARRQILELNLKGRPVSPSVNLSELSERLEGYSGADIRALCEKATSIPFLESIQTGVDRDIERADFDQILKKIKPSVKSRDLKKFQDWGDE